MCLIDSGWVLGGLEKTSRFGKVFVFVVSDESESTMLAFQDSSRCMGFFSYHQV